MSKKHATCKVVLTELNNKGLGVSSSGVASRVRERGKQMLRLKMRMEAREDSSGLSLELEEKQTSAGISICPALQGQNIGHCQRLGWLGGRGLQ